MRPSMGFMLLGPNDVILGSLVARLGVQQSGSRMLGTLVQTIALPRVVQLSMNVLFYGAH